MKFELHCDKVDLLPLQDLPNALASFFHLCFTFQMRYAEKVTHPRQSWPPCV